MHRLHLLTKCTRPIRFITQKATPFVDGYKLERTVSGIYPHPVDAYRKLIRHPAQEPLDDNKIVEACKQKKEQEYNLSELETQEQVQESDKDLNKTQ